MGRFLGITIKEVVRIPCWRLDGQVKELYEISRAWEPGRRSNFFFGPPAHLYVVSLSPAGTSRVLDENTSSVYPACRKRRLNGAVSRNNRQKDGPVGAWTGKLKNHTKCLWSMSPAVGPSCSSVRLHIYVSLH